LAKNELEIYKWQVLNNIEWLQRTYGGNMSSVTGYYKRTFDYILEEKADTIIVTEYEFWVMKDGKNLHYRDAREISPRDEQAIEGGRTTEKEILFIQLNVNKGRKFMFPAMAERDPVLSIYMKIVENTDERVEIQLIHPDQMDQ
jgi:hypothetical protein